MSLLRRVLICKIHCAYRYVLDGNALGVTATEAWRRSDAVELAQPSGIVVSIGYPLTDSVYGAQRSIDFQPVTPGEAPPAVPGVREGSDDFIAFIEGALRPFLRSEFPNVAFGREAIYGHSFGGLFVIYALLRRPDLFDTFLAASPDLTWNNDYILSHLSWLDEAKLSENATRPAFRMAYGSLEQYPEQRRTETYEKFLSRVNTLRGYGVAYTMGDDCNTVFQYLKTNAKLRDAELKEYVGSDHASVGAVALTDGLSYFVDW